MREPCWDACQNNWNAEVNDVRSDTRGEKNTAQQCQEDNATTTTLSKAYRGKTNVDARYIFKISSNNKKYTSAFLHFTHERSHTLTMTDS